MTLPLTSLSAAGALLSAPPVQSSSYLLTEGWSLLPDPSGRLSREQAMNSDGWRPARVGLCWNAQYDDLRDYMGAMWYLLPLELPEGTAASPHLLMEFGAVDYYCELFINGKKAGEHEGGYTPFTIDIARFARPGMNQIAVRVIDPPMDEERNLELCPEMMYNEIPHGKQSWYVQNGGIWQPVWLRSELALYVQQIRITPSTDGSFVASLRLAGDGLRDVEICSKTNVRLSILDPRQEPVLELVTNRLPRDGSELVMQGCIADPQLWDIDAPHLYTARVTLSGPCQAETGVRFGFRSFEARGGKLFLNGRPFYMCGVLDQDFHAESIHSATSKADVLDLMQKARQLGVNVMRCHLKICAPEYLDAADEVGMLVWAELPSWSDCWYKADHFSHIAAERSRRMFETVLARDWNHPSIVIQTIINESWGMDLQRPEQRAWLKERFQQVRGQLAPLGRLVVDNSPCEKNFHLVTDLEDFHNYYSMPDDAQKWEQWTRELASRPAWTFSPHGDAERTGQEPLLVSEFGNWGLPRLESGVPWWLECSFSGRPATNPGGVLERFQQYGFGSLFADYNAMAEATQWHQFHSLKHEIEDMRQHAALQGYVVTGLTDIHWEANGLLDQHRQPKVFAADLSLLQRPDLIMVRSGKRNYVAGEQVKAEIVLSHYGTAALRHAVVRWSIDDLPQGELVLNEEPEPGSVLRLPAVSFVAPQIEENRRVQVYVELTSQSGEMLTANSLDLFVFKPVLVSGADLAWHDPAGHAPELARRLALTGEERWQRHTVVISTQLDEQTAAHARDGGRVLLLCYHPDALPASTGLAVKHRAGCELDGRWFSNFQWTRQESPLFRGLEFGTITGFEAAAVTPRQVVQGIAPHAFLSVDAGMTYGWLAENSALAFRMEAAGERVLATCFRFASYGEDPYTTQLLNACIEATAQPGQGPKEPTRVAIADHVRPSN